MLFLTLLVIMLLHSDVGYAIAIAIDSAVKIVIKLLLLKVLLFMFLLLQVIDTQMQ